MGLPQEEKAEIEANRFSVLFKWIQNYSRHRYQGKVLKFNLINI